MAHPLWPVWPRGLWRDSVAGLHGAFGEGGLQGGGHCQHCHHHCQQYHWYIIDILCYTFDEHWPGVLSEFSSPSFPSSIFIDIHYNHDHHQTNSDSLSLYHTQVSSEKVDMLLELAYRHSSTTSAITFQQVITSSSSKSTKPFRCSDWSTVMVTLDRNGGNHIVNLEQMAEEGASCLSKVSN